MLIDIAQAVGGYLHDVFVTNLDWWVLLGFIAQAFFTARFAVPMACVRARRQKRGYHSRSGGSRSAADRCCCLCALPQGPGCSSRGKAFGVFVYLRNLYFVLREPACCRGGAEPRSRRGQRGKAAFEIGDQIAGSSSRCETQGRPARRPWGRATIFGAVEQDH